MLLIEEFVFDPFFRSFYSYETSELHSNYDTGNFLRSCPLRQRISSQLQNQMSKREDNNENVCGVPVNSKKTKPNKLSRDINGTETMLYSFIIGL